MVGDDGQEDDGQGKDDDGGLHTVLVKARTFFDCHVSNKFTCLEDKWW